MAPTYSLPWKESAEQKYLLNSYSYLHFVTSLCIFLSSEVILSLFERAISDLLQQGNAVLAIGMFFR